jgi:hypothetical protein
MALRKTVILRSPHGGRLEGRTVPAPAVANSFTRSFAGTTAKIAVSRAP